MSADNITDLILMAAILLNSAGIISAARATRSLIKADEYLAKRLTALEHERWPWRS